MRWRKYAEISWQTVNGYVRCRRHQLVMDEGHIGLYSALVAFDFAVMK